MEEYTRRICIWREHMEEHMEDHMEEYTRRIWRSIWREKRSRSTCAKVYALLANL